MIVKAVNQLDGREGTREEIIAKVEQNYPPITKNISLMRTLDQAFSKHLQIQPARIKLVIIQQEEQPFSQEDAIQGGFCLKNAIIDCLKSPESGSKDNSLEFDSLKNLLITKHADVLVKD